MDYTPFLFVNVSFSICFSLDFWLIFATYLYCNVFCDLESRYCSPRCSKKAYVKRKAEEKHLAELNAIAEKVSEDREYISVQEAVALFGISRYTIYRLINNGAIPSINMGKHLTADSNTMFGQFKNILSWRDYEYPL